MNSYWYNQHEAAQAAALDVAVLQMYAELGLIAPAPQGYGEADLAELRRARRLHSDLDLDYDAVAVVLRMRRRMLALQQEVRRLQAELRAMRRGRSLQEWTDAEWE
jgi:DNA-binding transcriptional MerR regulator